MEIRAYAKINLALDVIRKKENGYHELDMIMVPISLYDTLHVEIDEQDSFTSNVNLAFNSSNTIFNVIKYMRSTFHLQVGFKIYLEKKIPMQAGLAGGSSDAAAMIEAINRLCCLGLSETEKIAIGVKIGADVPFCIVQKLSRVQGIGEIITPIPSNLKYHMLLVKPKQGISTKEAFAKIQFESAIHPDINKVEKLMKEANPLFLKYLDNTLEVVAMQLNHTIKDIKIQLQQYSFDKVLMSGSGSTVFALSNDQKLLKQVKQALETKYEFVEICEMR